MAEAQRQIFISDSFSSSKAGGMWNGEENLEILHMTRDVKSNRKRISYLYPFTLDSTYIYRYEHIVQGSGNQQGQKWRTCIYMYIWYEPVPALPCYSVEM
jgi:hypothetical protein